MRARRIGSALLMLPGLALACGDDGPSGPTIELLLVAGRYTMTDLAFDPQGSLPEVSILATLGDVPEMTLTTNGSAQITFRDPDSNLIVTVNGFFDTTATGVRIDFADGARFDQLLLSDRITLTFDEAAGTLTFDGNSPDGADRERLLELVPDFEGEQLLDPVPGRLRIAFVKQ